MNCLPDVKRCETCALFDRREGDLTGKCHYLPAQWAGVTWAFSRVMPDDWCAHHQPLFPLPTVIVEEKING